MSNNTIIQTKKEFMDMLANTISDDQVILWTQNSNNFEIKPRLNEKRVSFCFSADAFERKDSIGDLMHGRALFAALVCDKSILSDGAKKIIP